MIPKALKLTDWLCQLQGNIKPLGASSEKYGKCEVCGSFAESMNLVRLNESEYKFGHRDCLNEYKHMEQVPRNKACL